MSRKGVIVYNDVGNVEVTQKRITVLSMRALQGSNLEIRLAME